MKDVFYFIVGLIGVIALVAVVVGIFALISLLLWGAGSAIVYLFALPVVWTFKKSFIAVCGLWCLKAVIDWFCKLGG